MGGGIERLRARSPSGEPRAEQREILRMEVLCTVAQVRADRLERAARELPGDERVERCLRQRVPDAERVKC